MRKYTALIKKADNWWIGRVAEVPGVLSQGKTREELLENLQSALDEALEMYRERAVAEESEGWTEKIAIE
ncbi:MAG TPA: type II toxin-antitoxin system HicB family antitoxin [Chthoniobacterales bacterium]|jgi:predicted RNase H-like HicB family nuclease